MVRFQAPTVQLSFENHTLENRKHSIQWDPKVVSTIVSDVLFACFFTIEHIPTILGFLCGVIIFSLFNRTVWAAGSTHIVLLPKNVNLAKE